MPAIIVADALVKTYGKTRALDEFNLAVPEGIAVGLLGPNGAGKTSAVRVLTTLLKPDSGHASVLGLDVVRDASRVRQVIGLSGQYAAVDENLTGYENLDMFGRLYHLGRRSARARASELLTQFDLTDVGSRPVKTYSGGMRRRLDLAASLVRRPPVLFLDEPTTGLDLRSRLVLWEVIADLVRGGTTVLLTTQYLEEADRLADEIIVIDHGKVIASGTPDKLKAQVGGERMEVIMQKSADIGKAVALLLPISDGDPAVDLDGLRFTVPVRGGVRRLADAIRELDGAGIEVSDITLRRPTLDDAFLALTGHGEAAPEDQDLVLDTVRSPV
jgi:ABC-2 type transport system ATP-binding protein